MQITAALGRKKKMCVEGDSFYFKNMQELTCAYFGKEEIRSRLMPIGELTGKVLWDSLKTCLASE